MLNLGFIGQEERKVDAKDRVPIPFHYKDYIEKITKKADAKNILILKKARGGKKCIEAMPSESWEKMVKEYIEKMSLENEEHDDNTWLKSREAFVVKIDSMGRIRIPKILKKFADIEKKAIFIGAIDRFQIWGEKELKKFDEANNNKEV